MESSAATSVTSIDLDELRRRVERSSSLAASIYRDRNHFAYSTSFPTTHTPRPCLSLRDMLPKKRARVDSSSRKKAGEVHQSCISVDYPTLVIFNTILRVSRIQNFLSTHSKILSIPSYFEEAETSSVFLSSDEVNEDRMNAGDPTVSLSLPRGTPKSYKAASVDCQENLPNHTIPSLHWGRARVVRPEGATVRDGKDIDSSKAIARYAIHLLGFMISLCCKQPDSYTRRRSGLTVWSCSHRQPMTSR